MFTLITAANTSSAYQLKNSLNSENILLGDYLELPEFLVKSGKILHLPEPQSSSYTHQMLALCLDKNIDTVYALRKPEIELLFASKQLFNEYDITILASDDKI
ncbi:MAG TPA: hypothetical protein VFE54_01910 [Mucilaginibacter sp.]|jgi:hypothetical protein|nr:hypothetical protein [Mucilaginibacter sp.]